MVNRVELKRHTVEFSALLPFKYGHFVPKILNTVIVTPILNPNNNAQPR
jgi:hypothetical protein